MGAYVTRPLEDQAASLLAGVDSACAETARLIAQADFFLLFTGAGFSADSGLAVYADVANIPAYAERGLTYHDICQMRWLAQDPRLFWGFWGQCFNDYRETAPHEGYAMIDRWMSKRFRHSSAAKAVREKLTRAAEKLAERRKLEEASLDAAEPYTVGGYAGAFFAFTSNVDAHHFDWFRAWEVRECHGNVELYQCAGKDLDPDLQCQALWRAPLNHRFSVNKDTMLANTGSGPEASEPSSESANNGDAEAEAESKEVPHVGKVRGGGRPRLLRYLPRGATAEGAGFDEPQPTCAKCGGPARPAILMFDDGGWQDLDSQEQRWNDWMAAVESHMRAERDIQGRELRALILEVGAGPNVTTVRMSSERCLYDLRKAGSARMVRINPDFPLGDRNSLAPDGEDESLVISIMARGLESLRKIDAAMPAEMRGD